MHAYLVRNDTSVRQNPVTDHHMAGHPRLADAWKRFAAALNGVLPVLALTDPHGAGQYWRLGFCGPTSGDAFEGAGGWGTAPLRIDSGAPAGDDPPGPAGSVVHRTGAMATTLIVSERTVEYHVGNLLAKLGAVNRTGQRRGHSSTGWAHPGTDPRSSTGAPIA